MALPKQVLRVTQHSPLPSTRGGDPIVPSTGLHGSLENSNALLVELLVVLAAIRGKLSGEGEDGAELQASSPCTEQLASALSGRLTDAVGQARSIAQTLGV